MVLLISSDNEEFIVDREVAERSALIKNMLEGEYSVIEFLAPIPYCPISDHFFHPQLSVKRMNLYRCIMFLRLC